MSNISTSIINNGRACVAAILCKRDNCTFAEAEKLIAETIEEIENCGFDPEECEEIMHNNLGLEMDYIIDLL